MAKGPSAIKSTEITFHALTSVQVVEHVTGCKFAVKGYEGTSGMIRCAGSVERR
jgi:RNA 3'-terminal phosphate cyclase